MSKSFLKNADAVSPVVGVMLMLVVTVIIAAVVSAYSSGMIVTTQKVPTGSFDCKISNGGSWSNSGFSLSVLTVSEPIQTKDVKLTTSWTTYDRANSKNKVADTITTIGLQHPIGDPKFSNEGNSYIDHYGAVKRLQSPLGYGPGVQNNTADFTKVTTDDQHFGNYLLTAGTTLVAKPYGKDATTGGYGVSSDKRYEYKTGTKYTKDIKADEMSAILGSKWYNLRPGDVVNVRLTYMPTGSVLFEKDVIVE